MFGLEIVEEMGWEVEFEFVVLSTWASIIYLNQGKGH